jgi:hypothetical protein
MGGGLASCKTIFRYQKAPGKGGHHLAPFGPLTHPRGKRIELVKAQSSPVKGVSMYAMLSRLKSGG